MALFGKKKKKAKDAAEGAEGEDAAEKEEGKEEAEEKEPEKPDGDKGEAEKGEGEGEEGKEGEAPSEDAAKKKKKKIIIAAAGGVVMLAVMGGAGAYFLMGGKSKEAPKTEEVSTENKPVYYDVPQLLVNLNTGSKTPSFIKATVTLELSGPNDVPIAQANLPRLLDSYNTFLREMKASDLYGSAGMYRLREELLIRANTTLAPVKVKDVLFKEILVQ